MAAIDFKNPDWYDEEDINIFREAKKVDRKFWNMAGEMGLLNCAMPEEYGGGGGDYRHEMIIQEELIKADVDGFGLSLHNAIVAPYILHYRRAEAKMAPENGERRACRRDCHVRTGNWLGPAKR